MGNKKLKYILITILFLSVFLSYKLVRKGINVKGKILFEKEGYYEIWADKTDYGGFYDYELLIHNKSGNIILKKEFEGQPDVQKADDSTLEISSGAGTGVVSYMYYDIENEKLSDDVFYNRKAIYNNLIVYMKLKVEPETGDSQRYIVIQDVFAKEKFYKEIYRDFSEIAETSLILVEANFIENSKLEIVYLKGTDKTPQTEIIDLLNQPQR